MIERSPMTKARVLELFDPSDVTTALELLAHDCAEDIPLIGSKPSL